MFVREEYLKPSMYFRAVLHVAPARCLKRHVATASGDGGLATIRIARANDWDNSESARNGTILPFSDASSDRIP